ncbi:MAG: penicillin-binding protein 2 [Hyphomicrobiaceae bacterium]|nr:penicillin-binding protein 2 [Hyphomicrobiaceae bacterium]
MSSWDGDGRDGGARSFTRRALLLGGVQLGLLGLLGERLYRVQVTKDAHFGALADRNRVFGRLLVPARGRILDRRGKVLADNVEGYQAIVVPDLAGDLHEVIEAFGMLVRLPLDERRQILRRARRQPRALPLVLARDLTWQQVARINMAAPQLPGVSTEIVSRRRYVQGSLTGHVTGYVGHPGRVALDDDPVLRLPGVRVGRTGVERGMDQVLRGESGALQLEVNARGRIVRTLDRREPTRGRDVHLTIDTEFQGYVMGLLGGYRRAAVVAMDVTSGDVLAMASVPSFDPNVIVTGMSDGEWGRLQDANDDPMTNRAIRGQYPPGSTFKMVTALAALTAGVATPRDRITCTGSIEVASQRFRCWKRSGHGRLDLHGALRESCDCYFYETALKVGMRRIAGMARQLGLGMAYPCGLALQKAGIVPDPDWKRGQLEQAWFTGDTVLASIGQGYVLSTPLQLAVMTARLASGRAVLPRIVAAPTMRAVEAKPLELPAEALLAVRRGMWACVNEPGGTGHAAADRLGRGLVAGKTGTSQVARLADDAADGVLPWEKRDHALFVGYAPVARPRYAVAAVLEHAGSGGRTAAPLVGEVLAELLRRDDEPESRGPGVSPREAERG